METNTYLTKYDVLNEASLWHGVSSTWRPRVMVSEPTLSYGQRGILGMKISQNGNGLPISCFASRGTQTHTCFDFSFSNHSQNLDFKTMAWKYLCFPSPQKNPRMSVRVLSESCRSWVLTALLTWNSCSLCLAAYPKHCDNLVWFISSVMLLSKAWIPP